MLWNFSLHVYNYCLMSSRERIAILASGDRKSGGGGSTADRVARDVLEEKVGFEIGVVICNNPAGTVAVHDRFDAINKDFGLKGDDRINVVTVDHAEFLMQAGDPARGLRQAESAAYCRILERYDIEFVSMLGFMLVLNGELIETRGWQPQYGIEDRSNNGIYHPSATISNNHPAILPFTADTHGYYAHQKAVDLYKLGYITHTAMTYHLAAAGVDTGPVFHAEPVAINDGDTADTLGDKVQIVEKTQTANAIERHLILRRQHLLHNP
jgi:folate-dependent phosphoribosylglycinamide formyltransferase PurN